MYSWLALLVWLSSHAPRVWAFNFVVLPDTQYATTWWEQIYLQQTAWCCDCADTLDIQFVMHLGDVVEHRNERPIEWEVAKTGLQQLSACDMPYSVLPGNHDFDQRTDSYRLYDQYISLPNADGRYQDNDRNTYYLVPDGAAGTLLLLSLQYESDEVESWASRVLEQFSDTPAIIASHYVTSDCSDRVSRPIRRLMEQHCNVLMSVGGHVFSCGGEDVSLVQNVCNASRPSIVTDYQGRERGGTGWLRMYSLDSDVLCAHTFSTYLERYEKDDTSSFSYSFSESAVQPACSTPPVCTSQYTPAGFVLGIFYVLAIDFTLLSLFLGRTEFAGTKSVRFLL